MVERYKIIEKIGVDDAVCPRSLDLIHIVKYKIGQDFLEIQYIRGIRLEEIPSFFSTTLT